MKAFLTEFKELWAKVKAQDKSGALGSKEEVLALMTYAIGYSSALDLVDLASNLEPQTGVMLLDIRRAEVAKLLSVVNEFASEIAAEDAIKKAAAT